MGVGQLNPYFQKRKKKWTISDTNLLIRQYEDMSVSTKQLALDLDRTRGGVCSMANKLGLRREKQPLEPICKVDGCLRKRLARGYCSKHYSEFRRSGTLIVRQEQVSRSGCTVAGCLEPHESKGFCRRHYLQVWNCGRILLPHEEGSHKGRGQCSIEGCTKNRHSEGLCSLHYRQQLKQQAVTYKGGKCETCGYDKHLCALDFHHIDSSQKEGNIADLIHSDWKLVKTELDKCILLCANCHREIHFVDTEKSDNDGS
jgi:hypothetical protein